MPGCEAVQGWRAHFQAGQLTHLQGRLRGHGELFRRGQLLPQVGVERGQTEEDRVEARGAHVAGGPRARQKPPLAPLAPFFPRGGGSGGGRGFAKHSQLHELVQNPGGPAVAPELRPCGGHLGEGAIKGSVAGERGPGDRRGAGWERARAGCPQEGLGTGAGVGVGVGVCVCVCVCVWFWVWVRVRVRVRRYLTNAPPGPAAASRGGSRRGPGSGTAGARRPRAI